MEDFSLSTCAHRFPPTACEPANLTSARFCLDFFQSGNQCHQFVPLRVQLVDNFMQVHTPGFLENFEFQIVYIFATKEYHIHEILINEIRIAPRERKRCSGVAVTLYFSEIPPDSTALSAPFDLSSEPLSVTTKGGWTSWSHQAI
jgi:hypothetical protein